MNKVDPQVKRVLDALEGIPTGKDTIIAAFDSTRESKGNTDCDGVKDEIEIQRAIDTARSPGGEVKLKDGKYHVDTITFPDNGEK